MLNNLSSKIIAKIFGIGLLILIICSLPFLIFISDYQTGPTFWNYEQHIDPKKEFTIRKQIGYNSFGDLDQLEGAIETNKVAAAISSDYQVAKLAKAKKIQKIDFKKLWNISGNQEDVRKELEQIYTPFAFKTLDTAFDLPDDEKLLSYAIPYAVQQKVIAFNTLRGNWTDEQKELLKTTEGLDKLFPKNKRSYFDILNLLHGYGYKKITINDIVRDNMMIGSEYNNQRFNSQPTPDNFKNQLDNFKNTIEQGFKQNFNSNNVNFDSDGTTVLENLINPNKEWDTAILYNGDALDAYYSKDKFPSLSDDMDNCVRVIFPENSINLVDLVIIPSYITGDLLTKVYQAINQGFFKNANKKDLPKEIINNPEDDYPVAVNFNYLYYSVAYEAYDKLIIQEFFQDDKIAQSIYKINLPAGDLKNHFTQPIDNQLFASIHYHYLMLKN